jgi:Glycine rich protein/RTX calcium-binding nonapeptide repeat (4 copies)
VLGAACALVVLASLPAGVVHATATATTKFSSPGPDLFTVPPGVTSITVTAVGGRGGAWIPKSPETPHPAGGKGAAVSATLAVSPGEQLFVRVGGPGGDGFADQGNGGAGGIGGGGAGGSSGGGILPGGGGGGASLVGASSPSPGFRGSLVVAGGGGGANRFTTGGDSGSPGGNGKLINCDPFKDPSSTDCGQGGAGTLTSGGARGSWPGHDDEFLPGAPGDFLVGGSGGSGHDCDNFGVCQKGGGGGGGGYYGGGGGNAYDYGGGGGGSSFVSPDATNVSMGLSSDAPSVALTYAAPTADVSPTTPMHFDLREPGTTSPAKILTVTNNGSAPLDVSAVLLGGSDPGDFLFNDRCQQPVAVGSSCEVGVRFSPQVSGARSATLTLLTNAAIAPPAVALLAGASAAAATCAGRAATSGGGAGADALAGTRGADVLAAGSGDDRIAAGGGNDLVCAGPGDDRVVGGAGNDRVAGGPGDDRVAAGPGDDRVAGGPGNDRVVGGGGQDRLDGDGGNDALRGGAGRDTLIGGAGSDTLSGGAGRDELDAGPGDDRVDARDGAPDRVLCGDGTDVVQADPSDHLTGCEDIRR